MTSKQQSPSTVLLNKTLGQDPNAIESLFNIRIPCNKQLADTANVVEHVTIGDQYRIGVLGIINAVLAANGIPPVAAVIEFDEYGSKVIGFTDFIE